MRKPVVLVVFGCLCSRLIAQSDSISSPVRFTAADRISTNVLTPLCVIITKSGKFFMESVAIRSIDPQWIDRIAVYKDQQALDKYGDKAANGVIEMIMSTGFVISSELRKKLRQE